MADPLLGNSVGAIGQCGTLGCSLAPGTIALGVYTPFSNQLCRGLRGVASPSGVAFKIVTWLILPVVICLSQRLSHACLSISNLYGETANGSLNQLSFI